MCTWWPPRGSRSIRLWSANLDRAYVAAPIRTADRFRLGTVNVIDREPRTITARQSAALADLAAIVEDLLDLRLAAMTLIRGTGVHAERLAEATGPAARRRADAPPAIASARRRYGSRTRPATRR